MDFISRNVDTIGVPESRRLYRVPRIRFFHRKNTDRVRDLRS